MSTSAPPVSCEMAQELSARLKELREVARQVKTEVKALSDSKGVTMSILRTSRVGKEAVKTARVLLQCHVVINEAVDNWKACVAAKTKKQLVCKQYKHCRMAVTFAGVVENGVGMQQIGTKRPSIDPQRMTKICKNLDQRKIIYKLYTLNDNLPATSAPTTPATAQLLVVPDYLQQLTSLSDSDRLYNHILQLNWDRKKYNPRTKKVCNSHARENNCFADISQKPNFDAGRGTIIAFRDTGKLQDVRADIGKLIGEDYVGLNAEGNKYDTRAVLNGETKSTPKGIGWHGDAERNVVVCLCLGMTMDLHFAWYHRFQQVEGQTPFKITLRHGDLYVMGAKTVGMDWRRSSILTVRHAAGDPKYTNYARKKSKKRKADIERGSSKKACP